MEIKIYPENSDELKSLLVSFKIDNDDCLSDLDPIDIEDRYYDKCFAIVAAIIDEQMVGRIKLYQRELKYNDQSLIMGGIGGVRVKPEFRRKGIAGEMMHRAMQELEAVGCDFVFLSAAQEIMGDFYKRFGFSPLQEKYKLKGKSGKLYLEDGGMIASISNESVVEDILNSKDSFYIGESTY
ncbi:GNAT family N-acetyltransferase [Candidatus Dojkabacteria bacterium]|uniref:GNAT family N-acetyltransferase n=1 Tax=Candidatus Dojkabacteria bacterium TaxID=2099670 RepID=A0A955L4Z3_9BACT|nr:GNAT family N-acetyltransferase [Candidatus Dojkabacteria bacterium]